MADRLSARLLVFALVLAAGGCSGLGQIQAPVAKFAEGAHSVATSEVSFLRAVETADCTGQFYAGAFDYAMGRTQSFDLSGACTPRILDEKEIQIRQALTEAVTLYADKLQALATNDDDKTLDANSQDLATKLNKLASTGGIPVSSVGAGVEAAVIAITEMALDQRRFSDVRKAAQAMQPSLVTVVTALESENTSFAVGIASAMDGVEAKLRPIVAGVDKKQTAARFFALVEARRIMRGVNPFGTPPLSRPTAAGDSIDPRNVAAALNAALDAVLNANKAIASAGTGGIVAAVSDLIARAQAAQATQAALLD